MGVLILTIVLVLLKSQSLIMKKARFGVLFSRDDVTLTRPGSQNSTLSSSVSRFSFGTVLQEKIGRISPPVRTTRRSSENRLPSDSDTAGENGSKVNISLLLCQHKSASA